MNLEERAKREEGEEGERGGGRKAMAGPEEERNNAGEKEERMEGSLSLKFKGILWHKTEIFPYYYYYCHGNSFNSTKYIEFKLVRH